MLAADHISAVKRGFKSRAMPEIENPPARPVDCYFGLRTGERKQKRKIQGKLHCAKQENCLSGS